MGPARRRMVSLRSPNRGGELRWLRDRSFALRADLVELQRHGRGVRVQPIRGLSRVGSDRSDARGANSRWDSNLRCGRRCASADPRVSGRSVRAFDNHRELWRRQLAGPSLRMVARGGRDCIGRAFGGFVIPPPSWFAVTAILSCALAVIPVAVSVRVFQAVAWKTPRESGATLRIAAKVQGLALLPVVWCLALGCLTLSIALAFGVEDSPVLGATLIALF